LATPRTEPPPEQKTLSMQHITHDALHDLLHFDSKLFKTLPALLFKPGLVTERTLAGEQGYVKPFTLFVFLNFLFFMVKSRGLFQYSLSGYEASNFFAGIIAHRQAALGISMEILTERFNTAMRFEQKEYLVLMVPLFALILECLYLFRRRPFATHLVFAFNFYSWFIVYMILLPPLFVLADLTLLLFHSSYRAGRSESGLVFAILAGCFVYLLVAVKRVYRDRWWLLIPKSVLLSLSVAALIVMVFRPALFFIVMHSIGE
jgi:Protein of unknown function (DUF3667)